MYNYYYLNLSISYLYNSLYSNIYILFLIGYSKKRETVGIKLDPQLWKDVQHRCIDDNLEYSEFVEQALREKLGKKK